jgi:hypothetical protein
MTNKVHWSFWLIGIIALLWNLMGAINFLMQMNPEMIASYRESERAIIVGRPIWATSAFALGVFVGTLGSVVLLVRKALSFYLFGVSLAGVVLTQAYTFSIGISFSLAEMLGIVLSPIAVAVFLVWYTKMVERRGWIE